MRTRMQQEAFPGEDIETGRSRRRAFRLLELLTGDLKERRYRTSPDLHQ